MPLSSKIAKANGKSLKRRPPRRKGHQPATQIWYRGSQSKKDLPYTIPADCQPELW